MSAAAAASSSGPASASAEDAAGAVAGLLVLVRDTDGRATANVVAQALRRRKLFAFGELLAAPAVQKVSARAPRRAERRESAN